jgi:hypothetical protein
MGYTKVAVFAVKQTRCKRTPFHRTLSGASTVAGTRTISGCRGRSRRSSNRLSHHDVIFVTYNLVMQKALPNY